MRPGDVILRAGSRLGPLEIANLISCGITEVDVFRPIRLAVLSTGDEIVDDPRDLGPGKIMNSNGPMLALLGRRYSHGSRHGKIDSRPARRHGRGDFHGPRTAPISCCSRAECRWAITISWARPWPMPGCACIFPPWPSSRADRSPLPRGPARPFSDFRAIRCRFT